MKKFVFTLERMLAYQEQNLEKEKGILARITAERDKLEEDRRCLLYTSFRTAFSSMESAVCSSR